MGYPIGRRICGEPSVFFRPREPRRAMRSGCGAPAQAAKKGQVSNGIAEKHTSAAKAATASACLIPGLKSRPTVRTSFSAACEARIDSFGFMRGLKPPPPSGFGFSAACAPAQGRIVPLLLLGAAAVLLAPFALGQSASPSYVDNCQPCTVPVGGTAGVYSFTFALKSGPEGRIVEAIDVAKDSKLLQHLHELGVF